MPSTAVRCVLTEKRLRRVITQRLYASALTETATHKIWQSRFRPRLFFRAACSDSETGSKSFGELKTENSTIDVR
jgi:hypothetical protein